MGSGNTLGRLETRGGPRSDVPSSQLDGKLHQLGQQVLALAVAAQGSPFGTLISRVLFC